MEGTNSKTDFEDQKTTFFSTESVSSGDMNDPDKNFFNDKLQEIDSPYFSFENFKVFSKQLKDKTFSICHLNIRSLSKNIDKLKEFLASLNGIFSVVVVTETWCDETANKNSLLEIPNYSALHKTRKNRKGGGICIYVHKSFKFGVRDDIDMFNESVETLSIEILNKKSRNIIITAAYRPPRGNNKIFKDFCKDFLHKQKISNKIAFLLGDFNLNALDYDNNEVVKNFFNLAFQSGFIPLIQRPTRVTRTSATAIDHILTNGILENKIQSGIIKTDISDHFPIFTVLTTNEACSLEKTKFIKRDISSENTATFKFLLENINWDRILPNDSPDKAYETFHFIFSDLYDTAFPKKKLKLKLNT